MNRNLTKRLMGLLLALVLLMSSAPVTAFAMEEAEAAQPAAETISRAVQTELEATIEQQVRAFAKSINKSNADDSAALAIAMHGITGGGKKLNVGSNHSLTATLMNSNRALECLVDGCVAAFEFMESQKMQTMYGVGALVWGSDDPKHVTLFYDYYPAEFFTSAPLDYIGHSGFYDPFTGTLNEYDKTLEWLVASGYIVLTYKQLSINETTVSYEVTASFKDRFDFHGNNGSISQDIASLLGSVFFKEFNWEATAKFTLEIPNSCDHTPGQYHLVYDPEKEQLNADTADGFMPNSIQKLAHESNAQTYYYYALQKPITLRHDRPWVLTYTVNNSNEIAFSSAEVKSQDVPYLVDYHRGYLVVKVKRPNSVGVLIDNFYGLGISRYFRYSTNNTYTFRLHNVVNPDGSNMIYVTVYNETLQKTELEETPMNDHYVIEDGQWVLVDDDSNGVNGIDLSIRYLSNQSFRFYADIFEMNVWECGVDGEGGGYFTSKVTKPTCTAQGYTTRTCSLCGYSYKDTYVAAKGHSYGGWTQVKAPNCTATGEEQRSCTTCKESETRAVAALGHDVVQHPGLAPTCTEDGWSDYESCNRCDYSSYQAIPAKGHSYEPTITPPTCTEDGYTTHTCACGDSYIDDEVSALGHDMGQWTVITEPFAGMDGEERRSCTRCDHYETRPIEYTGNLLKLEGEDLLSQSTVYINGLPYPVITVGGEHFVELPAEDDCTMVTYTYHVGDPDDIHTQYPVGMKVYMISEGEITYIEEFDNLLQYSGSSIRITGNKGIRMITSLYKDTKSALTGSGLAGFKLVEYGTVLAFAHEVEGDGDLVLGKDYSRSNYAYKKGVADPVFANTDKLTQYTNVLVGFNLDQCKEDIAMRPYIILENADGEQITLYGGTIYRSIGYVAYQNRNVVRAGTAAYNFVWDIIHHVYGDRYDSDYKG